MRIKLKKYVLSLAFILLGLYLYGCVEEPVIPSVTRAFSEVRVVNLSHNVNNMKILIDGEQPSASLNSLPQSSLTEYFDVKSGKRKFTVYNEAGELIYTKDVEISSYERISVVFSGFYAPTILENTFSNFEISEGEVYVDVMPAPGYLHLYLVHGSAAVDTFDAGTFRIWARMPSGQATKDTTFISSLGLGAIRGVGMAVPGTYDINFVNTAGTDSISYVTTFEPGFKYYLFIHGAPNAIKILENKLTPPPARSRD